MDSQKSCAICGKIQTRPGFNKVVQYDGKTLIASSKKRNDSFWRKWIDKSLIWVHEACRKRYMNYKPMSASKRPAEDDSPLPYKVQKTESRFEFRKNCFICGDTCSEAAEAKKPVDERCTLYKVTGKTDLLAKILRAVEQSDDAEGRRIRGILRPGMCLADLGARYHHPCLVNVLRKGSGSIGESSKNTRDSMSNLWKRMEASEEGQFFLEDLLSEVEDEELTLQELEDLLSEKYGDEVLFFTGDNTKILVTFRRKADEILRNYFSNKLVESDNENNGSDGNKTIKKAAQIILKDTLQHPWNKTREYSSADEFMEVAQSDVPETLKYFLRCFTNKIAATQRERKLTAIAHALISVVCPRTFRSSIFTSLGAFLHKKFRSKILIKALAQLGFCSTYNDVLANEVIADRVGPVAIQWIAPTGLGQMRKNHEDDEDVSDDFAY